MSEQNTFDIKCYDENNFLDYDPIKILRSTYGKAFCRIDDNGNPNESGEWEKWYNNIITISKKFPKHRFTTFFMGQDITEPNAYLKCYIRNGKGVIYSASFPYFNIDDLE